MKLIFSTDSITYPLTGIGRYASELLRQLQQQQEIASLRLFHGLNWATDAPQTSANPGLGNIVRRRLATSRAALAAYSLLMPRLAAYRLNHFQDHIYHGPNFLLPRFKGRSVCTIHDLSPLHWAHTHPVERARFMQAQIAQTLRRATLLITVSEYTRCEVAQYFGWPLEKIYAIPLASGPEFSPHPANVIAPLLQPYGLQVNGYTLYTGTIEPRKNIPALLDAYEMLPTALRQQHPLVLLGYRGWNSEGIHARIARAQQQGWAHYLGYVPAQDLPFLMAGACLLALPSLYEGFGLPVLEAMASGVPVVCSNSASLPEVVGDAAALHAAEDVDALYQHLLRGLEDASWRADMRQAGIARAAHFSWQRCAQQTMAVYRAAASA